MLLYHVSTDLVKTKEFFPRVPMSAMDNILEDKTQKRVCFSDSILGAISAIPEVQSGTLTYNKLMLYTLDTEKFKCQYSSSIELFSEGFVIDSLLTGEYWIYDSFVLQGEEITLNILKEDTFLLTYFNNYKELFELFKEYDIAFNEQELEQYSIFYILNRWLCSSLDDSTQTLVDEYFNSRNDSVFITVPTSIEIVKSNKSYLYNFDHMKLKYIS